MGMSHGFSLTSWHWYSPRREDHGFGTTGQRYAETLIAAQKPFFSLSHALIGIHEISHAWRGRLGHPGDRGPLMVDTRLPKRLALRLDDRARPVHGPCGGGAVATPGSWGTRVIM